MWINEAIRLTGYLYIMLANKLTNTDINDFFFFRNFNPALKSAY